MEDSVRRPASNRHPFLKPMFDFYVTYRSMSFFQILKSASNFQIYVLFQILKSASNSEIYGRFPFSQIDVQLRH